MPFAPDFEAAQATIQSTLAQTDFVEAAGRLERGGIGEERVRQLGLAMAEASSFVEADWAPLEEACSGLEPLTLPRWFLLRLAMANLDRLRRYPIVDEVKGRLLDFYLYVCAPDGSEDQLLNARHHGFRTMCRMALIRRFPAGQFDWEVAGFPRSWLLKCPRKDVAGLAWTVWGKAGGHRPFYVTHTSYRRELPIITEELERHGMRLLAGSMALQPEIRGVIGASWMFDLQLGKASPHLQWMVDTHNEQLQYGAYQSHIGPADPGSGFLVGDRKRRRMYESGEWKPLHGLSVWPRKGVIRWLGEQV